MFSLIHVHVLKVIMSLKNSIYSNRWNDSKLNPDISALLISGSAKKFHKIFTIGNKKRNADQVT